MASYCFKQHSGTQEYLEQHPSSASNLHFMWRFEFGIANKACGDPASRPIR
jgi:hypothetical protein